MPLNANVLAALMESKVDALSDDAKAHPANTYKAIAEAVIEHFTTAGVINVAVTAAGVAPPGGGPVASTGTGIGTIA